MRRAPARCVRREPFTRTTAAAAHLSKSCALLTHYPLYLDPLDHLYHLLKDIAGVSANAAEITPFTGVEHPHAVGVIEIDAVRRRVGLGGGNAIDGLRYAYADIYTQTKAKALSLNGLGL